VIKEKLNKKSNGEKKRGKKAYYLNPKSA